MKKAIIPMCAMLLLVTSCRSTKNLFAKTDVQQNVSIEQNNYDYELSMPSVEGKKSSYVYSSKAKSEILPVKVDVTKTIADLQVSSVKVEYSCSYNCSDDAAGRKAAINYAINQVLKINGNADVLLEPKYEVQSEGGRITSVKVSGYAATYCNFRTATEKELKMLQEGDPKPNMKVVTNAPQQD